MCEVHVTDCGLTWKNIALISHYLNNLKRNKVEVHIYFFVLDYQFFFIVKIYVL